MAVASRRPSRLAEIQLPEFGEPTVQPEIPAATYEARLEQVRRRMKAEGLDALVVYGDREHTANLTFLTGYDPRFEEALLVVTPGRIPTLFVGNEGWGYAELAAGSFERVLYQSVSLLGQPRDEVRALSDLLTDAGLGAGMRIGSAGWKSFSAEDVGSTPEWLEIPSFIADALRAVAGPGGNVVNANDLFMNPRDGLRAINDVDQLAAFEFAATFSSQALRNVIFGVRPGMTEYDAVRLMQLNGFPWAAHLMLSGGPRARYGLPSPSMRRLERGDTFTMACSLWGALNARAGFLVADASELPADIQDYVDRLVGPYFEAVVAWYETIGIGVPAGELWEAVNNVIGDPFFGVGLNPGHLIHLDEWLHSPVSQGSTIPLVSGMAFQVDVIPATGSAYFTTNIEDGIALADEELRAAFASRYPEAWRRIQKRRSFMMEVLGIRLRPEVLPFSNIPAYLTPFLLSPRRAMAMA
ncbi:MAG TPA: aminopeptidase P family N-terminal domain-containing protein [Microvirga sp.]|jgi:hypothetical protein